MTFQLGKLDAQRPFKLGELVDYATVHIPSPPTEVHYGHLGEVFPMGGNGPDPNVTNQGPDFQGVGDCVIVSLANNLHLATAEEKEPITFPTANQDVAQYFALTGGQDVGLVMSTTYALACKKAGLLGHAWDGFVSVDPTNIVKLQQAIAYVSATLGVQLQQAQMDAFENTPPGSVLPIWDYVPSSSVIGGHAIQVTGYDSQYVYIASWTRLVACTYRFVAECCDEAYGLLPPQFKTRGKDRLGLDYDSIKADLPTL